MRPVLFLRFLINMNLINSLRLFIFMAVIILSGLFPNNHGYAAENNTMIQSIEFSGNKFVENGAIQAEMDSKVGALLNRKKLSNDIRRLYKTGYFSDIKAEGIHQDNGLTLRLIFVENPLIANYSIEGNDEVVTKDLKKRLKLKEGLVFSDSKLRIDLNIIRRLYMKDGFYQLEIKTKKERLSDGRMDVTIILSEGEKTNVRQIRFVGNSSFSDKDLQSQIRSQEPSLMSWFSDRDIVDSKAFGNDVQLLLQYYQDHGFLDVNVNSAQLSLTPSKEAFYLTFNLQEGPMYTVSSIVFNGDIEPDQATLEKALSIHSGEIYSLSMLRKSIQDLTEVVGNEGYAFATVTPLFQRDLAGKKVGITFDIRKGREVYIDRIEISGNQKTNDMVIRREMRLDESSRYSATGMRRSKERLNRSQLFEDVRVSMPSTANDDKVDINVKVEEERTGSLIAGAGFSQLEKVMLRLEVAEKNLFGEAYNGNVVADLGAKTQNVSASISDPYFLNKDIGASLRVNKTQTQLQAITQYKQDNIGGGINFSFPLSEYIRYNIGYGYQRTNLTDILSTSSLILQSQAGVQTTGEFAQSISWDSRDRVITTSSGFLHSLSVNVAGPGGQNRFIESSLNLAGYFPLNDDFTLRTKIGGKVIAGFSGRDVPIFRRYSLGGIGSLRGYSYYGVTLRDPSSPLEPVGADRQVTASVDLFFPIPYMETSGFRGAVFVDAGTVWGGINTTVANVNLNVSEQFSTSKIRGSVGFGLEWSSPVGPITLSWTKAYRAQPDDLIRVFEFGLGTSF